MIRLVAIQGATEIDDSDGRLKQRKIQCEGNEGERQVVQGG